ncbi:kinase-like domain-containing protein [Sporodiniella umbellata]|nr:kinase-like domain-containing protein [Sporodiniella umbellata]
MKEVHILKGLSNTNVVKYVGFVCDQSHMNIILEYAENGSLSSTLKSFGAFPEKLVASFCTKILRGLEYLHMNDVVHCDLKAANILTTKTGDVKLTDFGVSLNLKIKTIENDSVSGTPYWMAPEVIELKGATAKSDVWSLGCTLIELVTGKPPYIDLLPMSAMFRIVEDEYPPLPQNISEDMQNFLLCCFQKDPEQRSSSKELQSHSWITKNLKLQQKGKRSDKKETRKEIVHCQFISSMSLDVVNGSNDLGLYHTTEEQSHASKMARVTTTQELEQFYSSNVTVMPLFDDNEDNNGHVFVENTHKKVIGCKVCNEVINEESKLCEVCLLVCHEECKKDAFSCPPKVNDQPPSYDRILLAKVYNTKFKKDKLRGAKNSIGTIKERGHHSSPSTLRNFPQAGSFRKNSRGYSQDTLDISSKESIGGSLKPSDKRRLLKRRQDEQCIIS